MDQIVLKCMYVYVKTNTLTLRKCCPSPVTFPLIAASGGSPAGTAATVLGVMFLACVACCIGLMYR